MWGFGVLGFWGFGDEWLGRTWVVLGAWGALDGVVPSLIACSLVLTVSTGNMAICSTIPERWRTEKHE